MKKQVVYFDMDGTLYDLYGQEGWLRKLRKEQSNAFLGNHRLITEKALEEYYPKNQYEWRICSMTPKNASKEYCKQVTKEKNQWLDKYFPSIKIRKFMAFGYSKNFRNCENYILVDDSEKIRETFKGTAVEPAWI